jgi:hypothetical protein
MVRVYVGLMDPLRNVLADGGLCKQAAACILCFPTNIYYIDDISIDAEHDRSVSLAVADRSEVLEVRSVVSSLIGIHARRVVYSVCQDLSECLNDSLLTLLGEGICLTYLRL